MSSPDRITDVVAPVLAEHDLVVDAITITPAGKRRVVRIAVDRGVSAEGDTTEPATSLSLDEVAQASHLISDAMDDSDVMGSAPYVLEVTSPGVERPLVEPRHFRRNVGRLVAVATTDQTFTGRLSRAGEQDATFEVDGVSREVAYADVTKANVQVEFNRAGAPELADEDEEN